MIHHLTRYELEAVPVREIVAPRGKELRIGDMVSTARVLLARSQVQTVPLLDGTRYVGAIDRRLLGSREPGELPLSSVQGVVLPVVAADTSATDALALLDADGGRRLVVVEADGETYVGMVCLRSDRVRLCVDAERIGLANRSATASTV